MARAFSAIAGGERAGVVRVPLLRAVPQTAGNSGSALSRSLRPSQSDDVELSDDSRVSVAITRRKLAESALRSAQIDLEVLASTIGAILWRADPETNRFLSVSSEAGTLLGYPVTRWLEEPDFWRSHIHPDDQDWVVTTRESAIRQGQSYEMEYRFILADGQVVWLREMARLVGERGSMGELRGVITDITEHRHDEALRAALRDVLYVSNESTDLNDLCSRVHSVVAGLIPARSFYIALYEADSNLVSFPYFVDGTGRRPPPRPLGKGLTDYVLRTGQSILVAREIFDQMVASGEVVPVGSDSIDWLGVPLRASGRVIGVLSVQSPSYAVRYGEREKEILIAVSQNIGDVIKRKEAEAESRRTVALLESTIQSTGDGLVVVDNRWNILTHNRRLQDMWGLSDSILAGRDGRALLYLSARQVKSSDEYTELARAAMSSQIPVSSTLELFDGRIVEFFSAPHIVDGRSEGRVISYRDITKRVLAEKAMQKSERRLRTIVDTEPNCLQVIGSDMTLVEMNRAGIRMREADDFEQVVRHGVPNFVTEEHRAAFIAAVAQAAAGEEVMLEIEIEGLRGTRRWLDSHLIAIADDRVQGPSVLVMSRDITDKRKAESKLKESEVMSAMGTLVASLAHEVRNPLFAISSTFDAFEARFGQREEFQRYITTLREQLERMNDFMQELLEYGRPIPLERLPAALEDVIAQAMASCSALATLSRVTLASRYAGGLPRVVMDRRRMVQVFHNLIDNAIRHAPPGSTVEIGAMELPGTDHACPIIECVVEDSGPGFRPEDLPRVFEPFFTRRRGGTGLGLAIVRKIVEGHDGSITVSNRDEGGAIVRVRLPGDRRESERADA